MKAYSEDLRKKVLTAYHDEEVSMRQLAEIFMISLTFVFNLIKNFRQNGHIRPKPHGGGNTPAINEEGFGILAEIIKKKSDMTLKELCEYYEDKTGKKVSKSAPDRTLKKMGITRKKKVLYDPEKNTVRVRRLTEEYSEKVKAEVPDNLIFTDANRSNAEYDSSLRKITGRRKSNRNPSGVPGAEDIDDRSTVNGRNGSLYDF